MELFDKIKSFPSSSGVYLMKDAKGQVIYTGKAIDLKKRVLSYFGKEDKTRYQITFLMKRVTDIEFVVTDSEKEALLLENNLIKKYHPRYNLQLRDDKSYASIKLTWKDPFPRISLTRQIKKDGSLYFGPYTSVAAARKTVEFIEKFFRLRTCSDQELANRVRPCLQYQIHRCDAPCVGLIDQDAYRKLADQVKLFLQGKNQDLVHLLEDEMQKQSEKEEFEKAARTRDLLSSIQTTLEKQKADRPQWKDQDVIGLYREGELMTWCVLMIREGKIWESKIYHLKGHEDEEDLLENFLTQLYQILLHPDEILIPYPVHSLTLLSQILTENRDKKVEIHVPQRGDKRDLMQLALRNAREGFQHRQKKEEEIQEILSKLQKSLSLQNFPRRMECFDISNISGQKAVGSLVSFVDGLSDKKGYRRFKIKTVHQPDDFSMMREVLKRRLLRAPSTSGRGSAEGGGEGENGNKWEKPDLIVVDGGKGQLNAVQAVMEELNITGIDLISLAKEKEGETQDKIFLRGRKNPVLLGRHSSLLHLLMRIRDEAHRFAITYHKKLREKAFLPSNH